MRRLCVRNTNKTIAMNTPITATVAAAFLLAACSEQGRESPAETSEMLHRTTTDTERLHAEQYEKECKTSLTGTRASFRSLEELQGKQTVDSFMQPLNELYIQLDLGTNKSALYAVVHPDEEIRKIAERCEQDFSKLATEISLSRPLYQSLLTVPQDSIEPDTKRWLDKLLRDFRRAGVDKDDVTRARIVELNEDLVELGQAFDRNVREDVRTIELDSVEELAGLPEDFIETHAPDDNGKIRLTTDYPDYYPFATYAHDDARRLEFAIVFRDRGYPANEPILQEILIKRYELAQLLGYTDYANYIMEDKMVGSAANAAAFIDKISLAVSPRAEIDYAVLLKRLQKVEPDADNVGAWQRSYIAELVRKEDYELDSKAVREYFAYDRVRDGIFDLVGTLFGVTISAWDTPVWHESVEAYAITENDEVIGRFYLDMHPRDGKYKHAAEFPIMTGVARYQVPVAALVCNFPGGDGSPGLMEHNQVETFLHEFGHLMHDIFGGSQRWIGISGISTEWDFVEAPSQMLEEWIWDKETLQQFAINEDGEVIPDELVEKMNAARDFGRGVNARHQMFYAAVSLNYYNRDPETFDLLTSLKDLQKQYSPYEYIDGTHLYANFGHLYGYSAIYYTYKWSEVISYDMFSRFEAEGLRNTKTAGEYRERVLSPGGSRDAADLVEAFLGRPYGFESYERRLNQGLEPK